MMTLEMHYIYNILHTTSDTNNQAQRISAKSCRVIKKGSTFDYMIILS